MKNYYNHYSWKRTHGKYINIWVCFRSAAHGVSDKAGPVLELLLSNIFLSRWRDNEFWHAARGGCCFDKFLPIRWFDAGMNLWSTFVPPACGVHDSVNRIESAWGEQWWYLHLTCTLVLANALFNAALCGIVFRVELQPVPWHFSPP